MTASDLIRILSVLPPDTVVAREVYVNDQYSSEDVRGFEYRDAIRKCQSVPDGRPPRIILQ